MRPPERARLAELLRARRTWELLPGPQSEAARCPAFELLYGGEAGGGKTELIAWLAKNEHHQALVLRRSFPELERTLIPRMLQKYPEQRFYNQANHVWRFPDGKRIELSYLDNDKDVFNFQGGEYDGFFPDELTQFPRDWYLYLFSRIRTTRAGQRTRVVATTNPGGEFEGWVKERWGPWLDKRHPSPAKSGEVRWYRRLESSADYAEEEVAPEDESVACRCADIRHAHAWSRSFIRAGIRDNPYVGREYVRNLDMLPEPYRTQLKRGDWDIASQDNQWQVIPTAWVLAAQERWRLRATLWMADAEREYSDEELSEARPPDAMTAYGLDVARGGKDWTVHEPVYVNFYAWPIKYPGKDTPDGLVIVEQIGSIGATHNHRLPDHVPINIDADGPGSSPFDIAKANGFNAVAIHGGAGSEGRDKSGMPFSNLRAEMYWSLREELDPASGADLCLPPHPEVLSDLAAARWRPVGGRIQVEPKEEIKKRIGRSPDVGDAIVYAHARIAVSDGFGIVKAYGNILKRLEAIEQPASPKRKTKREAPITSGLSPATVRVGDTVEITGMHLTDAEIHVDGIAASSISDFERVRFVAPEHEAGAVDVEIRTPGGVAMLRQVLMYV